jgi:DNA uptake protein ComE-like DNA-binding protein
MRPQRKVTVVFSVLILATLVCSAGCSVSSEDQRERDARTREEVAKATEKVKPVIEDAGRKLDEAAREAAHDVKATAQGVHDGLKNGPHSLVNVNSATENDLAALPGISRSDARRIIDRRPYRTTHDLLAKGAVSESDYEKIRDRVTAK